MSKYYAPDFVYQHAKRLYKEFKEKNNNKVLNEANFICLELPNTQNKEVFFAKLDAINTDESTQDFFFYDIILVERNLYLPFACLWALFFIYRMGKTNYFNYINDGAILGILNKYGYTPIEIQLHFFGIFASVHARKNISEK